MWQWECQLNPGLWCRDGESSWTKHLFSLFAGPHCALYTWLCKL